MFFSRSTVTLVAVALASLLPGHAAAAGQLGFALGVKQPNGACKNQADYIADMEAIKSRSGSTMIRIFDAAECDVTAHMLPAAKAQGFQAILGIWPDTEDQYNNGKQAIISNGNAYKEQVHAVIVGSESLYRGTYTADQLVARVEDMRRAAPGFRYGTSDSWNKYADGTADPVAWVSDIVLINAFSYWQGASINAAVGVFNSDIEQARARVNAAREGRPVETWVGETGWPTEGTTYQAAVPSLANAKRYYDEGVCPMVRGGGNVFVFEAFDEPWKPDSIGDTGQAANEKHWGAMTADRSEKFGLQC